MPFRNTKGIVTEDGDPDVEADVIMTAAALGFAASVIEETQNPIRFDMDPLEKARDETNFEKFTDTVSTMNKAIDAYLAKKGSAPGRTKAGLSPEYERGAVIMGVYTLAGKTAPQQVAEPVLSEAGQRLYDSIKNMKIRQYTGRGAYTGFVDNKNTDGDTNPVGPRSTARFLAPAPGTLHPDPHPRWLPPMDSPLWAKRKRKEDGTYVPWGMIGGDLAGEPPDPSQPNAPGATNLADQITNNMGAGHDGMIFSGDVTPNDIAAYTHGMIQAIYKAYDLGPNCEPYEIAVGDQTTKMASCLPCTLFMYATGYPPNSIHLGRGESWAPLYHPFNPNGSTDAHESEVIRDLNNAWYENCLNWLKKGLEILDDTPITENHKASHTAVKQYLSVHAANAFEADQTINLRSSAYTVGGVLILDAVTLHKAEIDRIKSTLAAG